MTTKNIITLSLAMLLGMALAFAQKKQQPDVPFFTCELVNHFSVSIQQDTEVEELPSNHVYPNDFDVDSYHNVGIRQGTGLAWTGEKLLIGHSTYGRTSNIIEYDLETGEAIPHYIDGISVSGMTWDGTHLWVVSEQTGMLRKVDLETDQILEEFELPDHENSDPDSWGIAWDGEYLWHSQYYDDPTIYKIDPKSGEVVSQFKAPTKLILGIFWHNGYLYGIEREGNDETDGEAAIYKLNAEGEVVGRYDWPIRETLGIVSIGSDIYATTNVGLDEFPGEDVYVLSSSLYAEETPNEEEVKEQQSLMVNSLLQSMNLYPNPTQGNITLEFEEAENLSISLYDMTGKQLFKQSFTSVKERISLELPDLPNGTYLCHVIADKFSYNKRLVISR